MTAEPFDDAYWESVLADETTSGSATSAGLSGSIQTPNHVSGSAVPAALSGSSGTLPRTGGMLDDVRSWLARFICTIDETDLDVLTLWAAHTHLCVETYTTPRLVLDSPVPGSGKTTVLEHFERLCLYPVQMASLSSPALLTRMLAANLRTILIDEADRSLSPDKEGIGELLAVLNSGYKRGGSRPVLVPVKGGSWEAAEMPTFGPVVMAGNNPNLPDDTRSRAIRVLLMPDIDGTAEESDWELLDAPARDLGERLALWANGVRDDVRTTRPDLPEGIRGRARERWAPLKRVAVAEGGRWPAVVDDLAVKDADRIAIEQEDGLMQQKPAIVLLGHLHEVWREGEPFIATEQLLTRLIASHPEMWGDSSGFGKRLTSQRLGRMLATSYAIHSARPDTQGPRGYLRSALAQAFRRFGFDPSEKPDKAAQPAEPDTTRATA